MHITWKHPFTTSAHRTLNSNKGVISDPDLQYVPESEILENLKDQGVTTVQVISITKNNKKKNTHQTHNTDNKHPKTSKINKSMLS